MEDGSRRPWTTGARGRRTGEIDTDEFDSFAPVEDGSTRTQNWGD